MENEAFELGEVTGEARPERNGFAATGGVGGAPGKIDDGGSRAAQLPTVASEVGMMAVDEMARYEEAQGVARTGNAAKLGLLLDEYKEQGWLRDWRNEENITVYADAIEDSFLDVIKVLLKFDIPLGDALIRAIDKDYDDAIKLIVKYLHSQEQDVCDAILNGSCDNGDHHPALTPLVLAAQRNSYNTVELLLELGASIAEPAISLGGDVTLTQAISTLHVYRALSQPAHILATQTDVFGYSFRMSTKLRALSRSWTDFGADLEEMAARIDAFTGQMLGQSGSTEEILALFRYHDTDKYRDGKGRQHPLSKMFEGIKHEQKQFIAHPHTQKAIIAQFYRAFLDWNEKGFWHQMLLMVLVLFGYPVISLLYIFLPIRKVVSFARQPFIMLLMNVGSTFTLLALIIAVIVIDKQAFPRTVDSLFFLIFIWIVGIAWMHMKRINMYGANEVLSSSHHLIEAVVIALYATVFFLQWNGPINGQISPNYELLRRSERDLTNESFAELQTHVGAALEGLRGNLSSSMIEGVNGILASMLSESSTRCTIGMTQPAAPAAPLHPELQATIARDQLEPVVVANALFGVTVVFAVLRLMDLLLISESVGPLRISLSAMVGDIAKFCAIFLVIWVAFAIGMFQTYFSAGQSATRKCLEEGGEADDCYYLTGFSTFVICISDLYWSLFGLIELDALMLPSQYSVAEAIGTLLYFFYHIMAVLVLLNALIGMLSNTYNLTEEHADTEWKFHRAALWGIYLRPAGTLPPPFNLIPSVKSVFRVCRYTVGIWIKRVRRKRVNRKNFHASIELTDYKRVLKLIRDRYIQAYLSLTSLNSEGIRPRDMQSLRGDIVSFRLYARDRMEALNKTLADSTATSKGLSRKLEDLEPLSDKAADVVGQNLVVKDNTDTLRSATSHLQEELTVEGTERDEVESTLRGRIADLQARAEEVQVAHAAETLARRRKEDQLMDVIRRLETDKGGLTAYVDGLQTEKSELVRLVAALTEEMEGMRRAEPETGPSEGDDDTDEAAEKLGLFQRVKKFVQSSVQSLENTLTDQKETAQVDVQEQKLDPEVEVEEDMKLQAEEEKAEPVDQEKQLEAEPEPYQRAGDGLQQTDEEEPVVIEDPTDDQVPRPDLDISEIKPGKELERRQKPTPEEDSIREPIGGLVGPKPASEQEPQPDSPHDPEPPLEEDPEVQPVMEREPGAEPEPQQGPEEEPGKDPDQEPQPKLQSVSDEEQEVTPETEPEYPLETGELDEDSEPVIWQL